MIKKFYVNITKKLCIISKPSKYSVNVLPHINK